MYIQYITFALVRLGKVGGIRNLISKYSVYNYACDFSSEHL